MLLTVGHGATDAGSFDALLRDAGVERIVDVRRYPGSRRHPQFGRNALSGRLAELGIGYRWDERLGGRRRASGEGSPNTALRNAGFRAYADHMDTVEWRAGIAELLEDVRVARVAVLCAESLWWRCHRRLVADAVVLLHEVATAHLGHDGRLSAHVPTAGVRLDGDRLVYDGLDG